MGTFKSTRFFPTTVPDLAVVAKDVEMHFRDQGFDINRQATLAGWQIDVTKGGMFKAVLGMRTAMKIEIETSAGGTQAKAGIGIWGQQAIPAAILLLSGFWLLIITQIWGMVASSKLDDEAMDVIGQSLTAHATGRQSATAAPAGGKFCTACGQGMPASSKFCPECGTKAA